MNYFLIVLSLILTFFVNASFAKNFRYQKCKLKKNQTLKIGCTKFCGKYNSRALKKFAKKLGYKIQLVNLYTERQALNIKDVDGVLIPGGADINPKYYINKIEPELQEKIKSLDHLVDYSASGDKRDPFEYRLLQEYFSNPNLKKTPILGICRGMQMLGVSQGIPLYIDLKEELGIKNKRYKLDKVRTQRGSAISKIMRKRSFRAVELHHQGPRVDYFKKYKSQRWSHINMSALSNKGKVAEVLEWTNRPVLGVQFHPEYTFGKVRRRIFRWFLNQSCHNKNKI